MTALHLAAGLGAVAAMAAAVRLRGDAIWAGWTGRGVGTARLMVGAVAALCMLASAGMTWAAPVVGAGLAVGFTVPELGGLRADGYPLKMVRGLALVALPVAGFWWFGLAWWPMLAAGASLPGCYAIGWAVQSRVWPLRQGPEVAEAILGAALGLGIALAAGP